MLGDLLTELSLDGTPGCAVGLLPAGLEPEFFFHGRCSRDGDHVSPHTLWEAASLSKPVVALLAVEESAQNDAFFDEPLRALADELVAPADDRWRDVSMRHALTHTTGLPNWRTPGASLEFESDPGTPGYSGEGYELLLAELATRENRSAESLVEHHLKQIGMTSSSFAPQLHGRSNVAVGHTTTRESISKHSSPTVMASGSLHTTTADYLRFVSAIARPGLMTSPTRRAAAERLAQHEIEILPGYGRTLGWAFVESAHGDVLWQHGDNPGFKHIAALRSAIGEAVVVLTNGDAGHDLCRQVCRRALEVDLW